MRFFLLILVFITQQAAAIEITSIKGTLKTGKLLTIYGKNFGNAPLPFLWDNVDTNYKNISNNKKVPVSRTYPWEAAHPWGENGSPWAKPVRFGKDISNSKGWSYHGIRKAYLKKPTALSPSKTRSLYVSWMFKPTISPSKKKGSNKFIRIWDDFSGKKTRISWTQMHLTYGAKDVQKHSKISWKGWPGKSKRWNRHEILVDSEQNIIKTWVNQKINHNINDFKKSPIKKGLTVFLLGFDPSFAERYEDLKFYLDDIYISSTQARVEISTSKVWGGGDQHIQPPTQWKENEITIQLNTDSLPKEHKLFLYVIDSTGKVNTIGFPLHQKVHSY